MGIPSPAPDRTCIVTGASSGIGAELAQQLAAKGHGVTLVARREDRLRELADKLAASYKVRAEVIAADLTDFDARQRVVDETSARGLTIEVLVNNAGFSTTGPVHQSDAAREVGMIRTDVEAVAHLCSAVLPGMVERGRGGILNVASTASYQPLPGQAGYGACKAFVRSYSMATNAEVKPHGVTVTALCPGPVETEFAEAAGFSNDEAEGAMPKMMWVSAADVASAGIEGLEKGRSVVIPGAANTILAAAAHLTPRRILLPVLARQHPALKRD